MRELLLLRHGRTESNQNKTFTGQLDVPLSDGGREELLARRAQGLYPQACLFFSSGMLRARETLALLFGDVPMIDVPDLSEYNFGDMAGRTHADLFAAEPIYRRWLDRASEDIVLPGGESRRQFQERITNGFAEVAAHRWTGCAVLVSHGGVINSILRVLAGKEEHIPVGNGCGYMLSLTDDGKIARYEAFA